MMHNEDEEPVYYCTKCLSLDIRTDSKKCMYCNSCGADVYKIDVTNFERWEELYEDKYGRKQIEFTSIYDDIDELIAEEGEVVMTAEEALTNQMNVGDIINRKIKD